MLTIARSPYAFAHMNVNFSLTEGGHSLIANFDKVTETRDGTTYLSGSAIDEFGWWHRRVTVDLARIHDMERFLGRMPETQPEPFRVGVRFEWRRGLVRLLVPDDAARRLRAWSHANWHECYGVGHGSCDPAEQGTWEHRALAYIHSVQSHLKDQHVFIEGESFSDMATDHDLFVSTAGVKAGRVPTVGFHFSE